MINYNLIAGAVHFYETIGYRQIEVPWLVSEAVSDITRPPTSKQYVVTKGDKRKSLIASGEQGFLYLMSKGNIGPGTYQTVTPCVRNDDFDDGPRVKYFVKDELIQIGRKLGDGDVQRTVEHALWFYSKFCEQDMLETVRTEDGWDIEYRGVEIGSYGVRECMLGRWVYGTGVAEPRLSRLLREAGRIEA